MARLKPGELLYIAMFSALIAVCAWVAVPWTVPFTMQTFAVFLAAAVLGGKKAAASVLVYILVGILGLPVFSGGQAGIGVIFSITGGYIIGFLPCAYVGGKLCEKTKKRPVAICLSLFAGLLIDYIFGIIWMCLLYRQTGLWSAAMILTFILPDIAKIILACVVAIRLQKIS